MNAPRKISSKIALRKIALRSIVLRKTAPEKTASRKKRSLLAPRACFVFTLALTAACNKPISTLPDLALPDVHGGEFRLRSQPPQLLVLAFLQTVPDTADTPSRGQVVFLASMAQQYGSRGLRVAIVDASALVLSSPPPHDAVLNASYDWQLKIPLLLDQDARLASKLGVGKVPTIFLIAADGHIQRRWQGLTRPAVLALAIERLLGGGRLARTP